jgi:hypothetical protein
MKTLTEKYRGVLNETFNKTQFVRDARMAWPNLISQFNGFEDTVSILKNKGMISDAAKAEEKVHNLSDEAIRRGVDFELEAMGLMSQDKISEEDRAKATDKAVKNLEKDSLHYLNLLSGESSKVDKHDKPVEAKKGNEVDTFNGMKKAELKEEAGIPTAFDDESFDALRDIILKYVEDPDDAEKAVQQVDDHGLDSLAPELLANLDRDPEYKAWYNNLHGIKEADPIPTEPGVPGERASNHDRKMAMRKIIDFLTIVGHPDSGYKVGNQEAIDFLKTHKDDIFNGDIDFNDINDVWSNYDEYETINTDIPEVMGVDRKGNKQPETGGSNAVKYKAAARDVKQEAMSDQQMKDIEKYGQEDKVVKAFKPGDMFSKEFDYEGMLEYGLKVRLNTPLETLQALFNSFEDVNYHSEGSHLSYAIDSIQEKDKAEALDHLRNFKKAIKKTLVSFNEGVNPDRRELEEAEAVIDEGRGDLDTIVRVITDMANEDGITTKEAALEVIEALRDAYMIDAYDEGIEEKKGKDHDGDGDVDKDDYMAAKDAAIKKSMGKDEIVKENIKAIISKVLEEQVINEAATNELAKFADQYGGFEGMKAAIIQLQDVVTDIEAYYDKTRTKIQKVYNTLGDIRNEEGLKVGGFLAPSIESAFNKDLRPVTKVGFTKGLDQPKVKVISQRDIDRNDMGSPNLGEAEPAKETVFSAPLNGTLRESKTK